MMEEAHLGGVTPVAWEMGEIVDEGTLPTPATGVGAEDRFDKTATFLRTDARRPRILETTALIC
jgi:hypothetical protein